MSPRVRRAMHEALDLVLDAMAEDAREAAPKRRQRPEKVRKMPEGIDELTLRRARAAAEKAGLA